MKLKTMFYRAAAGALCLLLCVSGLGQTALAAKVPATIPVDKKCSLTIRYQTPSQAATNVEFTVYRVAKVTSELKFNAEGVHRTLSQRKGRRYPPISRQPHQADDPPAGAGRH